MNFKFCFLLYIFYQLEIRITQHVGPVTYLSTERPVVVYYNKKYLNSLIVVSKRYSRNDPFYYINAYIDTPMTFGNNVTISFYFYEFQAYRYIRTFVELHYKLCDLMDSTLFGDRLIKLAKTDPCPFPAGQHNFTNLTIPMTSLPKTFPYRQGRLFCNSTLTLNGVTMRLGEAHIDMELKVASGKKNKQN